MVPIHPVKTPAAGKEPELPNEKLCYLLGSNGLHKLVENAYYKAVIEARSAKHLAELKAGVFVNKANLPVHQIMKPAKKDEPPQLPDDPLCYLVGANGVFLQVRRKDYALLVKCDKLGGLAELEEQAWTKVTKMPLHLFQQIVGFFRRVYDKYKAEAVVLLYYNPDNKQWSVSAPEQKVSSAHVDYDATDTPPPRGFERCHLFGSIHSHAAMGASHSGVDDKDEFKFDGVHITIGRLASSTDHDYSCRWMFGGTAFTLELKGIVESLPDPQPDPKWMDQVKERATTYGQPHTRSGGTYYGGQGWQGYESDTRAWKDGKWVARTGGNGTGTDKSEKKGSAGPKKGAPKSTKAGKKDGTEETDTKILTKDEVLTAREAQSEVEGLFDHVADAVFDFDAVEKAHDAGRITATEAQALTEELHGYTLREYP